MCYGAPLAHCHRRYLCLCCLGTLFFFSCAASVVDLLTSLKAIEAHCVYYHLHFCPTHEKDHDLNHWNLFLKKMNMCGILEVIRVVGGDAPGEVVDNQRECVRRKGFWLMYLVGFQGMVYLMWECIPHKRDFCWSWQGVHFS